MSATRHSEPFDVVVVVGSLGARQAFQELLGDLPSGFSAAVVFDQHRAVGDPTFTERILAARSALSVRSIRDGDRLDRGVVHVASPEGQLVLSGDGVMRVNASARGRSGHPSADTLLASGAQAFGPRLIAVVLSGRLDACAGGVREVKRHGGRVLVQDPIEAEAPGMPRAALATGCVDFCLPLASLGYALAALCASSGAADLFRVRMNVGVQT